MDAKSIQLCIVDESSCWLTHNIAPHTSLHDQSCHKTMKKYEDFEGMVVSLLHPGKFSIRTWFCNRPQYLCLFGIVVECIPSIHGPGKMLVLPNQLHCCRGIISYTSYSRTNDCIYNGYDNINLEPNAMNNIDTVAHMNMHYTQY